MSQATNVLNPYASSSPITEVLTSPAPALPVDDEFRALFAKGKEGAAWFYWIAGLSLVNTVMVFTNASRTFALGLGVTLISDSIGAEILQEPGAPRAILAIVLGFDLFVLGMVILCGWLSQKRILPIFALGMVLYLLDGGLCLLTGSIISIGIHGFALWNMWSGFNAYRQLNAFEARSLSGISTT